MRGSIGHAAASSSIAAYSQSNQDHSEATATPFVYTKYDAARVYLNSMSATGAGTGAGVA